MVVAMISGIWPARRSFTEGALPDYAPAFALSRYQDPDYCALLRTWGDDGQL